MIHRLQCLLSLGLVLNVGCMATSATRAMLSRNHQTTIQGDGQLHGTRSLPARGQGYRTYSWLGNAMGRQYGHAQVIETLKHSFFSLHQQYGTVYKVAEIGRRKGGPFWPHVTHRKGLSVDIMTPMRRIDNHKTRLLPTGPYSRFGYCWQIDPDTHQLSGLAWDTASKSDSKVCPEQRFDGRIEVDFEALIALLVELQKTAQQRGGNKRTVIVSPSFVEKLDDLRIPLSTKAWIEHDDHIHVEFTFHTPPK